MKRKENIYIIEGPKKFLAFTIATLVFILVMQLVKPKAQAKDLTKQQSDLLTDTTRINGIAYPYNLQALKPPNESPEQQRNRTAMITFATIPP